MVSNRFILLWILFTGILCMKAFLKWPRVWLQVLHSAIAVSNGPRQRLAKRQPVSRRAKFTIRE